MPVITTTIALTVAAAAVEIGIPMWVSMAAAYAATSMAISVGLSYAQSALAKTRTDNAGAGLGSSPATVNAPAARGNVKSAIPDQRLLVGTVRTGGDMFLYEVKPPYLYVGFVYSALPVNNFLSLYVGENKCSFMALPENQIVTPLAIDGQPHYSTNLQVCVQRGSLNQGVNAIIAADFPELGPTFITPGVPCCVFKCNYGADYDAFVALWGNVPIPNFQWVIEGVGLPDPRNPLCRLDFDYSDVSDFYGAVATWPYSDTSALAQNYWAMMPFGLGAGPDRMNWIKESIDFDEEAVPLKDGGAQKRHAVSAVISLSDKPNTVMDALFTSNRGYPSQTRGLFSVYSSQPQDPVLTITDDMLIGSFQFRRLKPKKELINIERCTFIAPDREYQDAEGPVLQRDDLIALDGEELAQSVRLSCTPTHQRAQRLMKGYLEEARLDRFLTCNVRMSAYGLREGMIVRRFSETGRYSAQDGLYSVEEWGLAESRQSLALSLSEYDPTIARNWNPATDEQPFVLQAA